VGGEARAGGRLGELRLLKVRHSTFLVEMGGARLLFDPWFSRVMAPPLLDAPPAALSPRDVGHVDAILVSAAWPDRFDLFALRRFADRQALCLVPDERAARRLRSAGFSRVEVVTGGQRVEAGRFAVDVSPALQGGPSPSVGYRVEAGGRTLWHTGPLAPLEVSDAPAHFALEHPSEVVLASARTGLLERLELAMGNDDAQLLGRLASARYVFAHSDELSLAGPLKETLGKLVDEPEALVPSVSAPRLVAAERGLWYRVVARDDAGGLSRGASPGPL